MPWGVTFSKVDMLPRHPAQLYEAIGYFIIFAIAYYVYTRKRKDLGEGFVFGLSVFLIFTIRFFIEYIKEVQEPFEISMRENWGVDMGQLLTIPFMVVCAAVMYYAFRRNQRNEKCAATAPSANIAPESSQKQSNKKFKKR
jgi:prolipoprotein diacylglyceryltransferase